MAMIERMSKHEYKVAVKINKPYADADDDLREIIKWCKEKFGRGGRNKKYVWRYGWVTSFGTGREDTFYFKFEKDALFFCMRWL
jgi:hypothetical protein